MWKPFDNRSRYSLLFAIEKISSENTLPKWFTYKKRFLSKIYPHFPIIEFFYLIYTGAHYQKPATTPCSCHGVFTDRSIFSLNLSWIQIPTGTSVTNCNHKHRLMLTCLHCFILTEACSCRLELACFAGKISKNRLVCENAVVLAYYGSCRLLVMASCFYLFFFYHL